MESFKKDFRKDLQGVEKCWKKNSKVGKWFFYGFPHGYKCGKP